MQTENMEIVLTPDHIPVLSKQNAAAFHQQAKERIYEQGGAFEYIEVIKFFAALEKQISGDKQTKIEEDKEFIDYLREEIKRQGNGGDKAEFKTARGVKFTLAEVGTTFDFSQCDDPILLDLERHVKQLTDRLKERKDFLKTVPVSGLDIVTSEGEVAKIFPPSKSSKSSFKVQLPK